MIFFNHGEPHPSVTSSHQYQVYLSVEAGITWGAPDSFRVTIVVGLLKE